MCAHVCNRDSGLCVCLCVCVCVCVCVCGLHGLAGLGGALKTLLDSPHVPPSAVPQKMYMGNVDQVDAMIMYVLSC